MPIHRAPHEAHFTIIANAALCDARLSFAARGLLAYLLTKPDDWQARFSDLQHNGGAGRRHIRKLIGELEQAGYMQRSIRRGALHLVWLTEIREQPVHRRAECAVTKRTGTKCTDTKGADLTSTELTRTEPTSTDKERGLELITAICGRAPRARDHKRALAALKQIRATHGAGMGQVLQDAWQAWQDARRTDNGQPYNPASLIWLTEWAVHGPPAQGGTHKHGSHRLFAPRPAPRPYTAGELAAAKLIRERRAAREAGLSQVQGGGLPAPGPEPGG